MQKLCELQIILNELEQTLKDMQTKNKWISIRAFAELLNMSKASVQTFKDRAAFAPFVRYIETRCQIYDCPDSRYLMRGYKYRIFDYEKEYLKNQAAKK